MKRYFLLFVEFSKLTLAAQMEYKLNFISSILVELAFMIIKSMYAVICYQNDLKIGSLDSDRICFIIGVYTFTTGIYMLFWDAFYMLPEKIKTGSLDLIITKPVSSQFMLTMTQVNFGLVFTNVLGGIIMMAYGFSRTGITITLTKIIVFVFLLLCSSILTYSLFLLPVLFAFKLISVSGINFFVGALWDINNMPMHLYSSTIRFAGLFIFPLFIINNNPGLFLIDELPIPMLIYGTLISFFWFFFVRFVWKNSIKHYASANG